MILEIALGAGLGVSATVNVIQCVRHRPVKVKTEPVNTYGHPKDPVAAILDRLPDVEPPLQWESWVDEGRENYLRIRLVDMMKVDDEGDFKVVASTDVNLTGCRRKMPRFLRSDPDEWEDTTWENVYNQSASPTYKNERFDRFLEIADKSLKRVYDAAEGHRTKVKARYNLGK